MAGLALVVTYVERD